MVSLNRDKWMGFNEFIIWKYINKVKGNYRDDEAFGSLKE